MSKIVLVYISKNYANIMRALKQGPCTCSTFKNNLQSFQLTYHARTMCSLKTASKGLHQRKSPKMKSYHTDQTQELKEHTEYSSARTWTPFSPRGPCFPLKFYPLILNIYLPVLTGTRRVLLIINLNSFISYFQQK